MQFRPTLIQYIFKRPFLNSFTFCSYEYDLYLFKKLIHRKLLFYRRIKSGITGRLNGAGAEAFWGQAGPQANAHHMHQPKMPMGPGNSTGWEEPSPPSQRRNMPNYDDGTSLWGNPQPGQNLMFITLNYTLENSTERILSFP